MQLTCAVARKGVQAVGRLPRDVLNGRPQIGNAGVMLVTRSPKLSPNFRLNFLMWELDHDSAFFLDVYSVYFKARPA